MDILTIFTEIGGENWLPGGVIAINSHVYVLVPLKQTHGKPGAPIIYLDSDQDGPILQGLFTYNEANVCFKDASYTDDASTHV